MTGAAVPELGDAYELAEIDWVAVAQLSCPMDRAAVELALSKELRRIENYEIGPGEIWCEIPKGVLAPTREESE